MLSTEDIKNELNGHQATSINFVIGIHKINEAIYIIVNDHFDMKKHPPHPNVQL